MMAKVHFWKIDTKKRNATNPSEEHGSYISSIIILDEKSWSSTDIQYKITTDMFFNQHYKY
jgi:hypothetical protein